ncbi:MAG: response regulator transcription factor [Betaproteobacteria bacterium]|nr:response regulator transcription factor [Betaproteobacteria bacterium]
MNADAPTVYIVDDEPAVRESLALLLRLHGFVSRGFASGEEFLSACAPGWAGCVLLDLRMPGMSGLALQAAMADRGITLPVVVVTAHGDVAAARAMLKAGALDFLEKPLDKNQLLAAVRAAFERNAEDRAHVLAVAQAKQCIERLTPREREVLDLIVAGQHNREIAAELGISARTVEVYKARLMEKLRVDRLPDLIRLMLTVASDKR